MKSLRYIRSKNNSLKTYLLFFLLAATLFIGAFNSSLTFVSLGLCAVLSVLIGAQKSDENENVPILLVALLAVQNFCIGTGAHIANNTSESLRYLTQFPFISIFFIWLINFIKHKKTNIQARKFFYIFIFFILASFAFGRGEVISILLSLRNLMAFYFAYEIGIMYLNTKEKLERFCNNFIKITFVLLVLGILTMLGGYNLYVKIGFKEVYIAKAAPVIGNELKGRFYTKIFYSYLPRMGSIIYEPINLAYFFSFGMFIAFFKNRPSRKKWLFAFILNATGLILTVGKGGTLVFAFVLTTYILSKFLKKYLRLSNATTAIRLSIFITIITLYLITTIYLRLFPSSFVVPHFWGIANGMKSVLLHPLGYGVGNGGNIPLITTSLDLIDNSNGSESGLITVFYQLGIFGGASLIVLVSKLAQPGQTQMHNTGYLLACGLLIASLFQENTFGPQCISYFMFYLGALYSNQNSLDDSNKEQSLIEKETS